MALLVCMGDAQDRISARAQLLHFAPTQLAFQPDGRHLVMMRHDFMALYDTLQNKVVRVMTPQQIGAALFVDTNGSMIAVTQQSAPAVYETNTLRLIRRFDSSLELLRLSPTGAWVALRSRGQSSATIYFVNLYDGRSYSYTHDNLYSHFYAVLRYPKVCFAPDEQRAVVVVALRDPAPPQAFVIRLTDGAVENQFEFGHADTLPIGLSVSPTGRSMAVFAWHREATTGDLLYLDLQTGSEQNLSGMAEVDRTGIAWLSDETLLFGTGYEILTFTNGIRQKAIATGFAAWDIAVQPGTQRLFAAHRQGVHTIDAEDAQSTVYEGRTPQAFWAYHYTLLSPNREWVVVPKFDGIARQWGLSLLRARDLTEIRWIATGSLTPPLAISNDAQRLVIFSGGGLFRMIDVDSGQTLWQRTYSSSATPSALFIPDGSGIILCLGNQLYRIDNGGNQLWQTQIPAFSLRPFALTADNKILALRGMFNRSELIQIDLETLEVGILYQGFHGLQHAALTPDGDYLALSRRDSSDFCSILLFRYPSMEQVTALLIENYYYYDPVAGLQRIPVALDSYAGNNEFHVLALGTVNIIDAETARLVRRIPLQDPYGSAFWRTPNGWITHTASTTEQNPLLVFHYASDTPRISAISVPAARAVFADEQQVLFSGDIGGVLWNTNAEPWDYQRLAIFLREFAGSGTIGGACVVGEGYLVTMGFQGSGYYWYAYEWPTLRFLTGNSLAYGDLLARRYDSFVRDRELYNWVTGQAVWRIADTGLSGIRSVTFSPNGHYALIWLNSGVSWMYDTRTNQPLWSRAQDLSLAKFSLDSRYLLNYSSVYDVQTGALVLSAPQLQSAVYFDGRFAVLSERTPEGVSVYRIVDFPTMRVIAQLDATQTVTTYDVSFAASPDNRWLMFTAREYSALFPNPYGRVEGDANLDGCVDDADLLLVLFSFSSTGGLADLTFDGIVDDADLLRVLLNFGNGC
ncbi:MAG: hypothetical protein WHS44_00740 [Fimbriimonadales bacterium]